MNQERIRERKGQFNGHDHNHDGQHAHQMRLDASQHQVQEHFQPLIEGNIQGLFDQPPRPTTRPTTIYEIGQRAMRRITRSGKR